VGALVSAATMFNVFMMNMSYGETLFVSSPAYVRVASASGHAPSGQLLCVEPRSKATDTQSIFSAQVAEYIVAGLPTVARIVFGRNEPLLLLSARKTSGFLAPPAPLYGIWMVDEFAVGGQPRQADDQLRWQQAIFDNSFEVVFQSVNGKRQRFIHQTDVQKKTVTVWRRENPGQRMLMAFDRPQQEFLTLDGKIDGKQIHARLHHVPEPRFLLNTRGFHWINEYPFNRYNE